MKFLISCAGLLAFSRICAPVLAASPWFGIHVVDAQDGRGVPLVELKTTGALRYYTDSAGYVAIDDPVVMGRKVFFFVGSDGYTFPADAFGMRGRALDARAGADRNIESRKKESCPATLSIHG